MNIAGWHRFSAPTASRRGRDLQGQGRRVRRGRPRRGTGCNPGGRSLACVAQPGRIRQQGRHPAPRLPARRRPPGRRRRRGSRHRTGTRGHGPAGCVPGRGRPGAPPRGAHPGTLRRHPRPPRRRPFARRDQPRHRPGPQNPAPVRPRSEGGRARPLAARTRERYADIRARLDAGHSHAEISRATGLVPRTVRRFAQAGSAEELLGGFARVTMRDEEKPSLCRRWNEGARDATALHAELQKQGWTGSARTVRRYLAQVREPGTAPAPPPAVPKARQITRLLLTRPDHLEDAEREQLARIRAGCPHIDAFAGHIAAFAEMMDGLTGAAPLAPWLAAVEAADGQPELRSFASGIRGDKEAVLNGLTLPHSSGRVEGIVNKVKAVKRQMYGRASFALLPRRIILHPA